jgi:hypothetical protein
MASASNASGGKGKNRRHGCFSLAFFNVKLKRSLLVFLECGKEEQRTQPPLTIMEQYQELLAELGDKRYELTLKEINKTPGRWRVGASILEMETTLASLRADAVKKAHKETDRISCSECGIRLLVRDTWIHPELENYALAEFLGERVCYSCREDIINQLQAEYHDYTPEPEPDYESEGGDDSLGCPCRDWMCPGDCGVQPCGSCIDTCKCDREW